MNVNSTRALFNLIPLLSLAQNETSDSREPRGAVLVARDALPDASTPGA